MQNYHDILIKKREIISGFYEEMIEMLPRIKALEAEFGHKYNPGQPRDDHGRWTSGGGDGETGVNSGDVMDDAGNISSSGSSLPKPDGIPDDWVTNPADNGNGIKYTDPTNRGNEVRVMQGNPDSPYPTSQQPYVRWMNNGQWLDVNGNVTNDLGEVHIPLGDFEFMPEIFP